MPTVAGNLKTKRIYRGGEVRGEQERSGKGGRGGSGRFTGGIRRGYGDMNWREEGGASVHSGKSNVVGDTDGSRKVHVAKYRQSIVYIGPQYRVQKNTTLLCARLQDTETG